MLHKDKQDEEVLQDRGKELLRGRGKDVGVVDLLLLRKHHMVSRKQFARALTLHHQEGHHQEGHQVHILLSLNMANLPHQEHILLSQHTGLHLLQAPLLLIKDSCPTSRAKFQEGKVECSLVPQLV
jgi:hypothetical protein